LITVELEALLGRDSTEIDRFGNHNRKYLFQLQKYGFELAQLVSPAGLSLDAFPDDPESEVTRLVAKSGTRAPQYLGAYFSIHYLKLNAAAVSRFRLESACAKDRYRLYRTILGGYERKLSILVRALFHAYASFYSNGIKLVPYTVLNVGSLTDHEDIDVALVADAPKKATDLDMVVSNLSQEFFRRIMPLHFYLAEQFEERRYWGSLADYTKVLDIHLKDFVVVGQLLTATRLAGSQRLYKIIIDEVHRRYLSPEDNTQYREGFLRGTLGELDVLLGQRDLTEDSFNPKREIYRLIKLLVAAVRTIFHLRQPGIIVNLKSLIELDPAHAVEYRNLRRAFSFNESFRYLYNLLVIPTDEIQMENENVPEALSEIGMLMGFGKDPRGPLQALVLTYAEHLAKSLGAGLVLSHLLRDHLKEISIFRRLLADGLTPPGPGGKKRDAALNLLEDVKRTEKKIFWEEIPEVIQENPQTLARFVDDLARLPRIDQIEAVRSYVLLMTSDLKSLVELLIFLSNLPVPAGKKKRAGIADLFLEAFLECLNSFPHKVKDYGRLVVSDPELLARFVRAYSPDIIDRISSILASQGESWKVERQILWHRTLLVTEHGKSRHLGRLLDRVLGQRPEVKRLLGEPTRLKVLAEEVRREASLEQEFGRKRKLLGESFDIEMLRLALGTLLLAENPDWYKDYMAVVDDYVNDVLKTCMLEVWEKQMAFTRISFPAGLSIYATGGNARGEGLADDYDFIALLDDRAAGERSFYNKTVAKFVTAIGRHGLLAHNRFAEHVNSYVMTIGELRQHLDADTSEGFIDQSELVDARLVVGDPWLNGRLKREILRDRIYLKANEFLSAMVKELKDQDSFFRVQKPGDTIDVKQGPGGLRTINLVLLMAKAKFGLYEPITPLALEKLRAAAPNLDKEIYALERARRFIKRVRDVYRLTVAYSDAVRPEHMDELVPFVYGAVSNMSGRDLARDLAEHMATSRDAVWRMAEQLTHGSL